MDRLLLVRHATTAETRRAAFPATSGDRAVDGCAPLDRAGLAQAAALAGHLPAADQVWSSLARRALQTAAQAGLRQVQPLPELAEAGFGAWSGRRPDEVDTAALARWHADPAAGPPGGESLPALRRRVAAVLARARGCGGTIIAVTHGGFVKAALLEALDLPAVALWRLDAAPASVTELHPAGDGWRLVRLNWSPRLQPGLPVTP